MPRAGVVRDSLREHDSKYECIDYEFVALSVYGWCQENKSALIIPMITGPKIRLIPGFETAMPQRVERGRHSL